MVHRTGSVSYTHLDVYKRQDGNHSKSAKAEGSLTATPTGGAGTKVGLKMCIRDRHMQVERELLY